MQVASLYIRVSTDEQANRGFSLRYQEEVLRQYSRIHDLKIKDLIVEDYSAKNFRRPEWIKWLNEITKHKRARPNLLLFTKWDRFSRNTGDAYYMISVLNKMGIEPRAVEQPLDVGIPENKMMMAFYLAIPEVENARRALNVKQGIWKARKEGRWVGTAPLGYENRSTPNGIKYIAPKEPQAKLMKRAFELLAEGTYNVSQVFSLVAQDGLGRFSNVFRRALRNPVYCGKVKVPAFENEVAFYVQGVHEPIISEQLFNLVQKVVRKKEYKKYEKVNPNSHFPFRGSLICPACGKNLTGSGSRGKSGKHYYYYHCSGKCKMRIPIRDVEDGFVSELRKMSPNKGYVNFLKEQTRQILMEKLQLKRSKQEMLLSRIEDAIARIHKAEELMLQGTISGDDYRRIKSDNELQINILGDQISFLEDQTKNVDRLVKKSAVLMEHLHQLFWIMNTRLKKQLANLLFPKGLIFELGRFMPPETSEGIRIVYNLETDFHE